MRNIFFVLFVLFVLFSCGRPLYHPGPFVRAEFLRVDSLIFTLPTYYRHYYKTERGDTLEFWTKERKKLLPGHCYRVDPEKAKAILKAGL